MAVSPTTMAWTSAGVSMAQSVFGAMAASKAASARRDAAISNIESRKESYIQRLNASYEQMNAIDEELGTVMSRRGLEALKAEARLRTAGASTGLSGASIDEVVAQSGYDELLDNQVAISRARKSKTQIQRQKLADWINFKTQGSNIVSSMPSASGNILGSLVSGLGSGLGVYTSYLKSGGKELSFSTESQAREQYTKDNFQYFARGV